jgi:hypothetical protein
MSKVQEEPEMCRLVVGSSGKMMFESATNHGAMSIEEQIEADKQYGIMRPANGEYFTYQVYDWQGDIISVKQARKAVTYVWEKLERKIQIDIRRARRHDKIIDFKVYFRYTKDDEHLTENTVMYHYYPINNIHHPLRGVCVVNIDYPFTANGEPVDLHFIDPKNYPEPTGTLGTTYDFDAIYTHEGPGHGMGLPHSTYKGKIMSRTTGTMAEHYEDENPEETLPRLYAKYPKRNMPSRLRRRWIQWYRGRSENY